LSADRYEDILIMDHGERKRYTYSLEFQHSSTHEFVGGDMGHLATGTYDPSFFLLHAFVDYIWQLFRDKAG
jgi:tyrosinase